MGLGPLPAGHPASFYSPAGEGWTSLESTRGPWSPEHQHAGPPAALLGREMERCEGVGGDPGSRMVVRVTYEILGPVPIAPLYVSAGVVRPGRRVDMVEGELRAADGSPLVRARAWRMALREVDLGSAGRSGAGLADDELPEDPGSIEPGTDFFPTGHEVGYHSSMEYRFASGTFLEPGPATTWMRMRIPLVEGEEPTPLQRVLAAADSGNGVSSALDYRRYLFVNVDLTVHLHRLPQGEWVCLDARTIPETTGVGMSDTLLLDERGPIGRAAQSLLVDERPG